MSPSTAYGVILSLYLIGMIAVRDDLRTITDNNYIYTLLLLAWPAVELAAVIYTTLFLKE